MPGIVTWEKMARIPRELLELPANLLWFEESLAPSCAVSARPLSIVFAQNRFHSDLLNLRLTARTHFEPAMTIASTRRSLRMLTFVEFMIERVGRLPSRYIIPVVSVSSGNFLNGLLQSSVCVKHSCEALGAVHFFELSSGRSGAAGRRCLAHLAALHISKPKCAAKRRGAFFSCPTWKRR